MTLTENIGKKGTTNDPKTIQRDPKNESVITIELGSVFRYFLG